MNRLATALAAAVSLSAFASATAWAEAPATPAAATAAYVEPAPMKYPAIGFDPADLDRSVRPGNDFDAFVNGKWAAVTSIPPQFPYYGVVTDLRLGSDRDVRKIVEELAKSNAAPGTLERRIGDSYNAYLDTAAIDAAGLAPAKPYLDAIAGANSVDTLVELMGKPGYPAPLGFGIGASNADPDKYEIGVGMGGLGLPDRDNYLVDNPRNLEMRAKYKDLVAFFLGKAGDPNPKASAEAVYNFERQIAEISWDRALRRNPLLTDHPMTGAELIALAGDFPIARLMEQNGLTPSDKFNVANILPTDEQAAAAGLTAEQRAKLGGGFPAMLKLVRATPLPVLKAWMATRFIGSNADLLPSDIDAANFAFYGQYLQGRQVQRQRWERAVAAVQGQLGEGIGKVYVERHFPASSKAAMIELVSNLRAAQAANIAELPWMTPATRATAKAKLDAISVKIGYPDEFKTYEGLTILPDQPLANRIATADWTWKYDLARLHGPVDRSEWFMSPQTVNAYYNPSANEIVFPAAYLQAPMFSPTADPAINYGAIGATIGHEIGHGFDDQGSRFGPNGKLENWWTEQDRKAFDERTEKLVKQYDAFCPLDDGKTCINGRLTLGENIGDLGGISMAYKAYRLSLKGKKARVIDGLTGDQRFFISYAQHQRTLMRDAFQRQIMQTDPHSPDKARINEVLRNFDPWYAAFDVKPGDKLYLAPKDRVRIW
jgi:putative endopeptidase